MAYIKSLSEKIEKVCAPLRVKAVKKPVKTLRQDLIRMNTRISEEKQTGVVYEVPCNECEVVCVG